MKTPKALYCLLCFACMLHGCFKMRWSDKKALAIFQNKEIPLAIFDTVIANRHIHYAISSNHDSLPLLVFIHGSPGSWYNYNRYMRDKDLRARFQVMSIDRPGFGYSDFGKALPLDAQTKLIAPVLQQFSGKPIYLFGHSMGGPVSVKLAAEHPELFEYLIIAAGAIDVKQEKKEAWRHFFGQKGLRWVLPGAYRPSNTELLYLKKDLIPLQDDFALVRAKVLFIHGDRDNMVPIENIALGEKLLKNAKSIRSDTLYGADHQIPWKNFKAIKQILLNLE